MSEKQIPTASTLTTSCVGRGASTGFARLCTSCPAPTNWIACWVAGSAGAWAESLAAAQPVVSGKGLPLAARVQANGRVLLDAYRAIVEASRDDLDAIHDLSVVEQITPAAGRKLAA